MHQCKTIASDSSPPYERKQGSPVPFVFCLPIDRIGQREESPLRDLQEADRRKDAFLAMLGHEMRNPLAPIRNAMQIFRAKGANDPEIQELAEMVERQIQQLTRLVDDLVDVTRVGECGISLRIRTVNLKSVVAQAVESSRPLIESRRHVLTVSLPECAVEIEGDPGRLTQVVSNLLNNSAKYSEDGGHIELILESIRDRAVLCVRDAGIGIEPAMLPRIFDLFVQVKASPRRVANGLGIGLALVRNVVELHGGSVVASSAGLGCGTELVVSLPLQGEHRGGNATAPGETRIDLNASARRILVVDDNRDATDSMATLLRLGGHDVRIAYDGQTALAMARIEAPDVVICDISMPGMGGCELAHHLREDLGLHKSLLIALSGYAQDEDRRRSQEAGFNAHLTKPVHLDNLKQLLANMSLLTVEPNDRQATMLPAR